MELERKIVAGILMCGVVTVFIIVSALVILTGRNPFFVKKKLAVGALLITLSAVISGCRNPGPGVVITCYDPGLDERVTISGARDGQVVLDRNVTDTIQCIIMQSVYSQYSIMILDSINTVVQKETVYSDTAWKILDAIPFTIVCNNTISQGTYSLRVFNQVVDSVKNVDDYRHKYVLRIVN